MQLQDGLSALPRLRELYAAFNDIADLEPLQGMDCLEVLDLEANNVSDPEMLYYLYSTPLKALTLAGNPLAAAPDYKSQASRLLDDRNTVTLHALFVVWLIPRR